MLQLATCLFHFETYHCKPSINVANIIAYKYKPYTKHFYGFWMNKNVKARKGKCKVFNDANENAKKWNQKW